MVLETTILAIELSMQGPQPDGIKCGRNHNSAQSVFLHFGFRRRNLWKSGGEFPHLFIVYGASTLRKRILQVRRNLTWLAPRIDTASSTSAPCQRIDARLHSARCNRIALQSQGLRCMHKEHNEIRGTFATVWQGTVRRNAHFCVSDAGHYLVETGPGTFRKPSPA